MKNRSNLKKQSGFTLVELLFAVIALCAATGISYVVIHFLIKFW